MGVGRASGSCKVHTGFYAAYAANGVHKRIIAFVGELLAAGPPDRKVKVLLTGHSLGGAIACLLAFDMVHELSLRPERTAVYTYGAPRLGNHAFVRARRCHFACAVQCMGSA